MMMMINMATTMNGGFLLACLLMLLTLASSQDVAAPQNVMDVLRNAPDLMFFTILLETGSFDDGLSTGDLGDVTLFAPTDGAFESVDEEFLSFLLTDVDWRAHLQNILGYHIVPAPVQLINGEAVTTLIGEMISVSASPVKQAMTLNNGMANVGMKYTTPDSGSIVFGIDALLDPGWLNLNIDNVLASDEAGRFSTFLDIGSKLILIDEWRPLTVFAPTNSAFDASGIDFANNLDESFLFETWGIHVVEGVFTEGMIPNELTTLSGDTLTVATDPILRKVSVNGRQIVDTNLFANNGVIHVVEGLLSAENTIKPVNPVQLELCEFQKFTEEAFGVAAGVSCVCEVIGVDSEVKLSCTSSEGQCSPKNGACDEDQEVVCCHPSQRRCVSNQCRDSRRPERVKIGAGEEGSGGAVRPRRDRNGSIRSASIP